MDMNKDCIFICNWCTEMQY